MSPAVTLRLSFDQRTFQGTVVETRFGREEDRLEVSFPSSDAPGLEEGQVMEFTVQGPALPEPLELTGIVREVRREAAELRLALACPVESTGEGSVQDRRGAMRARPDGGAIVASISVWDGDWTCDPLVNDVSATGFSFLVPSGTESLEEDQLLAIGLYFEGEGTIDFAGRVRYRRETGPYDLYGVEFDAVHTHELARKQLLVHFFVERALERRRTELE